MPSKCHFMTAALAAIVAGTLPQTSFAQAAPQTSKDKKDKEAQSPAVDSADIVVTGSRIRGAAIASDVITLDQQAIVAAGQIDLGEAIRSLPQNFGGGQNPGVGFGAGQSNSNVNSASSPNLRGLGPDATLTLLNGHRLPNDSAFGGVDISAIPLAALDRIEVVPDGASALYGSDAVAGVINVILRRDFDGVATSAQLGASTDGGYFRQQADIVGGKTWKGGGFLLAYDFARNSDIQARERSYTSTRLPEASLYPSQHRHAAIFAGYQQLGEAVLAKVDALYSRRKSRIRGGIPTNRSLFAPEVETYTIAPSLEISIGSEWEANFLGVFGRDRTHYSGTFTPLVGTTNVTEGCYCNGVTSFEFGAEGPVFSLGGGDARLAVGGGFRSNSMDSTRNTNGVLQDSFTVRRRSRFAYGELNLPFVSPELQIRGIDKLSLSGAVRYEDYSGLDQLATPRVGLIYAPISDLVLRASWSRSFKAPTLYQQYVAYEAILLPAAAFGAGTATSTVFFTAGGNPDLKSERAKSWTAGFEWQPQTLEGFRLSMTFYDIRYRDRVVQPIAGSLGAAFRNPGYASLIDFSPSAALLNSLVDGAEVGLQNFSGRAFDPANVVALIDNRNINVAAQTIRGVDGHLSWSGQLASGDSLGFDLSASWLESRQLIVAELPEVKLAGSIFSPPKFRAKAAINYQNGDLKLSSSLNFTGALTDARFATASKLSKSATFDIGASYDLISGSASDPGLSLSVTINNVLNDKPEVIRTTGPTDTPYDSTNFSPIGRFVAIGIRRQW
nr:TonB-dependent receptor [uncultured Sphingorhabdus sp.]